MQRRFEVNASSLQSLNAIVAANPSVDWRTIALDDNPATWVRLGFPPDRARLALLRAYQRILRVLPPGEEARALSLLGAGFDSALRIASIPRAQFHRAWLALFAGDTGVADQVYERARSRRMQVAVHHIKNVQNGEPHYRATRFR